MATLNKFVFAVAAIIFAAIAPVSAQVGPTATTPDNRVAIELPAAEYEHVMHEMRQFLASISNIMAASLRNEFNGVATAARMGGRSAPTGIERSIAPKLPPAFRQLAFDTHARFDRIAIEAEKSDRTLVFTQVSELLSNCVGCHSSYSMRMK